MGATLAVNPGSSSKKYALYESGRLLCNVQFEKKSDDFEMCTEIDGERQRCEEVIESRFESSIAEALSVFESKCGIKKENIHRIGIRTVAPGTFFQSDHSIDDLFIRKLEDMCSTAPLHTPLILREIKEIKKIFSQANLIAVSDSAFHSTIPEHARMYSISINDAKEHDIFRFGYHGLSVGSLREGIELQLGNIPPCVIVCHVGSGVSVTALKDGKSIDTSMGFSPVGGLMMGTRAGDLDIGALIYLMKVMDMSVDKAERYVNTTGGFLGITGSNDMRVVFDRMHKGDQKADVALKLFFYVLQKEIGASMTALGGLDALVLTATAAERNPLVRSMIVRGLEGLGILIDEKENDLCISRNGIISSADSAVKILVQKTNEMKEIAKIAENF